MASNSRDDMGGSCSADSQKFDPRDWPSMEPIASPTSTSPAWNTEDDDDSGSCAPGTRPSDLYGKFTWKIENFSQISKRELRSNIFEVGGYKWYILVYPQGCDVCNHLSLFLCVADYDKLLPGWSHFAQFTIAVVNKDPKKSKYSDTLHRFCKKEHDWGWKKFMELSKVFDGFIVADTLVIKAQVQVIRENPHRPFRCLDCQYRRELIRVYLTNVESICRRFVEEKREKIGKLLSDSVRWSSFRSFWSAVEENMRCRLSREKADIILKAIVKCFFNEKEVTSTLVMDALYSGYRALDCRTRNKKGVANGVDVEQTHSPIVWIDKEFFVLSDDMLLLLERAANELMPFYKDEKGPQNRTKDGCSGDDFGKDNFDRDERRLTELGRRTVEMFVLGHLFSNRIEVAYLEAIALKRQEELIREEEAAEQAEIKLKAKREAAEKEKRNKKKQAKQRRNSRKEKDKLVEIKHLGVQESRQLEDSTSSRDNVSSLSKGTSIMGDEDNDSSVLDNVDGVVGTLRPAIEDGDADWMIWEREGSEMHLLMEASFSGGSCLDSASNGLLNQAQGCLLDDSSSTCSSDSILSLHTTLNGTVKKRSNVNLPDLSQTSMSRSHGKLVNEKNSTQGLSKSRSGNSCRMDDTCSCSKCDHDKDTIIASLKKRVEWLQRRLSEKEELVATLQKQLSCYQHQIGTDSPHNGNGIKEKADSSRREIKSENMENVRSGTDKLAAADSVEFTPSDVGYPVNGLLDSKGRSANDTHKENLTDVHAALVTTVDSDSQLSRPSSAPDLPESSNMLPEPTHLWNASPSLTRSVSSIGRLGSMATTTEQTSSLSSMRQSSVIIPSYRNAAVGVTRSSSPFSTCSTTGHSVDAGFRNDLQCTNISLHGGSDQSSIPHSVAQNETASLSDSEGIRYTSKSDRMDAGNSSQQSDCRENTMGFTFGTVTPEMLHQQQQQRNPIDNDNSAPEFSSQKLRRILLGHPIPHCDFSSADECEKSLSQHIALPVKHTMTDMSFSSATMPEEFPHLDIINELLDDDKMLGAKALNVFLQQAGSQIQSPLNAFDLQRICGGQIGLDVNSVIDVNGADRTDRSVMSLDNCTVTQFSNGPDPRIGSHGDSVQLLPYSCSISQHGGLSMSEHHWQGTRGSLRVTDGFQNDMDVLIGYPMQTRIPIPDCPPFTLGQNGYSLYSPVQHP